MQNLYLIRRFGQFPRVYNRVFATPKNRSFGHSRDYATRKESPGFSASKPSARSPRTSRSKESKDRPPKEPLIEETKPNVRWKFPIRPRTLILFSIVAYLGYRLHAWQTNPKRSLVFNPRFFTPFILESRDKVSSTSSILHLLSVPKGQNTKMISEAWRLGVWSVEAIQPELQISRSYTPLPPEDGAELEQVRLFVRQEPQGEVSTFLHNIYRGTIVNLRGPRLEYEIPEDVDEVLFLAGGTGIAPALQVAHVLYNHRTSSSSYGPRMRILWANRRREDSYSRLDHLSPQQLPEGLIPKLRNIANTWQGKPNEQQKELSDKELETAEQPQTRLVEEVENLKSRHAGKVNVDYFVDEEGLFITETILRNALGGIEQASSESAQNVPARKKLVLISGPEGFVNFFAGAKKWQRGKEIQGPLGGLLQEIAPQGWDIWKL
ncbi:mitochondrial peripheral inner membrane protein [Mycoblastus sanguinarius]|nr:mitochondrial peripheral inner membrane protein [Mycoblastus sanguinarius]